MAVFLNCGITAKSNKLYVDCLSVMAITKFYLNFFFSIEEVKISFTHLSQNRPYFVCLFAVTDIIS